MVNLSDSTDPESRAESSSFSERLSLPWLAFAIGTTLVFLWVFVRRNGSIWLTAGCLMLIAYFSLHAVSLILDRLRELPQRVEHEDHDEGQSPPT